MILTCPLCTTRYVVAEGAIGTKGRRVRCANCGHQWTQEAEIGLDEELFGEAPAFLEQINDDAGFQNAADDDIGFVETPSQSQIDDDDFESILRKEIESAPIPEGVRPAHEEYDPVLAQLGKKTPAGKSLKLPASERVTGFVVAACFYLCIIGVLLMLQPQISRVWPASNLLYNLVGMKPVMPGEGLSLDELRAEISDGKISMKGTIINLRSSDTKVPAVLASIVGVDDEVIDKVLIPPPVARLKGEGQASFDVVYPKIPDGAQNVTFAFSYLSAKSSSDMLAKEDHKEEQQEQEKAAEPSHEEKPAAAAPEDEKTEHAPALH